MGRGKYNARRVEKDGFVFDSMAEARRYAELQMLERAGEISGLSVHPRFLLQNGFRYRGKAYRKIEYVADFAYHTRGGDWVVEDVKGMETQAFRLKEKLFLRKYGGEVTFVKPKAQHAPQKGISHLNARKCP